MEAEARPKHEFTEKVADVFCRWVDRFYPKLKKAYEEKESCYDIEDYELLYVFYYPSKPFYIKIEWDLSEDESKMTIGFGPKSDISTFVHLFCRERTLESLHEWVREKIGTIRRFCICGQVITMDDKACDYCYILWHKNEEPCVICYDDEGRWVRLKCDCKGGRIIHSYCWDKICNNSVMRCPCCRKTGLDVVNDPHFD